MSDPRLLTVILNFRTPDMTLQAVAAALRAMDGIEGEIVVVDNDSGDGSFENLHNQSVSNGWTKDGRVRVLQSGRNGGFGAGNNYGIQTGFRDGSRPDYVYVLNSDAFPAPDAIQRLLDYLQTHPETGFAGSYIHGPDGDPHLTTFRFPSIASEFEAAIRFGPVSRILAKKRVPIEIPDSTQPVDWLAGASLMMRRDVLDQIGLFDETFFLYFEETDLCLRARRAGYQTVFVRDSDVAHIGSVSTGMKQWQQVPGYWFDSRLHYFTKNHGAFYAALATLAHLTGGILHRLRQGLQGRAPTDPPHFLRTLLRHDLTAMFKPRRHAAVPRLTDPISRSDGSVIVSE
ncbi:N-acetylglucosaminyl-diphospho-decaprenol L-rhamnosyltransferase [Thalassovita gelatinovora]|uniref:N-acetylglucosaminyl-diphospho-decaprenol L-rhamnosyltransferase n=1 Tax=Thalassovita gelatinovora TaxID=53501 RepID=A0A0N7LUW2_THAGE|nr:glycosyltransferase family 2 protein [Thalassovita gelatinovora]QIZ81262.1 glycosyltransferase family 2 protein [Thalassovita gelatinovora]CUH64610.1 N-acetylglucosaminyl-diphospho-decaprenol L-rhamnosyltransferase [Thalassovita gelatinovora]SEP94999.1 Glycosyltransferase like family 2 [Thalassovita gelatinovora]